MLEHINYNWVLWLVPTLLLLGGAVLTRLQFGNWLAPTPFFCLYWGGILSIPLLFTPTFYFWPAAAWFILFAAVCLHTGVQTGYLLGESRVLSRGSALPGSLTARAGIVIAGCTLLGMLSVPLVLHDRGYSLLSLVNPQMVLRLAHDFSVARYHEAYVSPFSARILWAWLYLGALIGGLWLGSARSATPARQPAGWSRLYGLLPLFPATLLAVIQTTRSSILYPLVLISAAACAAMVFRRKRLHLSIFLHYLPLLLLPVVVFGVFLGLDLMRSNLTLDEVDIALNRVVATAAGSPVAFAQWASTDLLDAHKPAGGVYSLGGVFQLLGIGQRQVGQNNPFIDISPTNAINVYTIFRGLILDFTLPGALLVLMCIGLVAGYAYRKVQQQQVFWVPWLVAFYAYTLLGNVSSIFNYNSILLAWGLFTLALLSGFIGVQPRPTTANLPASRIQRGIYGRVR